MTKTKTRLNEGHRLALRNLAHDLLTTPPEDAALAAAYATAAPLVRAVVETALPPADMAVLKKYDLASVDNCTRLQLANGMHKKFFFNGDGPLAIRCRCYLADQAMTDAVLVWLDCRDEQKEARLAKQRDYEALIQSARTYEEVLEVWPEAERLRPRITGQELTTLSPDVIVRIRADVAARQGKMAA